MSRGSPPAGEEMAGDGWEAGSFAEFLTVFLNGDAISEPVSSASGLDLEFTIPAPWCGEL